MVHTNNFIIIYFIYKTIKKIKNDTKLFNLNFLKTNLEIIEKLKTLTKNQNSHYLIENYIEEILFENITGINKTSKAYRDKISLLVQTFPKYHISYFISISYLLNVQINGNKIEKITLNIDKISNAFYWFFNIIIYLFMFLGLISLIYAFIDNVKYLFLFLFLLLLALIIYKIIEDIDKAKAFCKQNCDKKKMKKKNNYSQKTTKESNITKNIKNK